MRMPKFDSAPMAGFTLIEALVATALMGFILAALATITAQWLPNWNHGVVRVQRNEQVALGLERLAADLAAADFIPANNQTRKPFFDGASRSVTFVRTALGPDTGPGLEFVRIAEISSERGPVLVRTRAPFVPGIDRATELHRPRCAVAGTLSALLFVCRDRSKLARGLAGASSTAERSQIDRA